MDLLLVHWETMYFCEQFQSIIECQERTSSCFSFIIYFGGFCWFDEIWRQVKYGRWSDMFLISIAEYDFEVLSDNLEKVWSITEPVFFVKRHGCTILDKNH